MAGPNLSVKRLKINQANTLMVAAIAISSFIVVFSLVASKALLSQRAYQSRVITKKESARDQLKSNVEATGPLGTAYSSWVGTPENILKGDPNGDNQNDGDNAKIILDALPSKYDYPAVATSLEKLMLQNHLKIDAITGTDQEVAQASQQVSQNPKPVEMPFEIQGTASYGSIQNLVAFFELSIRPFYIDSIEFSGNDKALKIDMKAKTYFQPERDLTIKTEVIK